MTDDVGKRKTRSPGYGRLRERALGETVGPGRVPGWLGSVCVNLCHPSAVQSGCALPLPIPFMFLHLASRSFLTCLGFFLIFIAVFSKGVSVVCPFFPLLKVERRSEVFEREGLSLLWSFKLIAKRGEGRRTEEEAEEVQITSDTLHHLS